MDVHGLVARLLEEQLSFTRGFTCVSATGRDADAARRVLLAPCTVEHAERVSPTLIVARVCCRSASPSLSQLVSLTLTSDEASVWRIAHMHCSPAEASRGACNDGGASSHAVPGFRRVLIAAAGVAAVALAAARLDYRAFTRGGLAALLALEVARVAGLCP